MSCMIDRAKLDQAKLTCKNMMANSEMKERELTATESRLIYFDGSSFYAWEDQPTLLKSQNMSQLRHLQPRPMEGVLKDNVISIQILIHENATTCSQHTHQDNGRFLMSLSKLQAKLVYLASLSL